MDFLLLLKWQKRQLKLTPMNCTHQSIKLVTFKMILIVNEKYNPQDNQKHIYIYFKYK